MKTKAHNKAPIQNSNRGEMFVIVRHGIAVGIIAGMIFITLEMIVANFLTGSFLGPLKMIAGIPLQQAPTTITEKAALLVGLPFHMAYSVVLGIIASWIIMAGAFFRSSIFRLLLWSTLFGILVWFANFYILAAVVNATWFYQANLLVQFLLHTFGFGTIIGIYFVVVLRSSFIKTL